MSDLISGLNIQNIFEYDSSQSYEKYDVVDYELNSGFSIYPTYTGFGGTGLSFWFSNDLLESFKINANNQITGWINNVKIDGDLTCSDIEENGAPIIDLNENYTKLIASQIMSGSGYNYNNRTLFLAVNPLSYIRNQRQNIIGFGTGDSTRYLSVSGENENNYLKILLDNNEYGGVSKTYNNINIFTLVQDDSNIRLRHNGIDIGTYSSYNNYWKSGEMYLNKNPHIAESTDFKGINYHELFHFTGVLQDSAISGYEKYLFEKYFSNNGLYFAYKDVPAGASYSPITFTGQSYWTQKIDDLFTLSYGSNANFSAKLSRLDFGDGYKTNVVSTLNSLNSKFSLVYDGLTDKQSKALIAFFENSPETKNKSLYEGFEGVRMNLFTPYKNNAELYFLNINHDSSYKDINKITIEAESLYESILDYKGMFVSLNENTIRTYSNQITQFEYNDVFYYNSTNFIDKGYYFYTGATIALESTGPSGPFDPQYSPTGNNSYFTREFYFKPDIDYNINENIRLRTTEYKNSTKEYSKDGINYNMLEFDLKFSKRSTKEARALLKFLDDKAGYKVFNYTLQQPYNKNIQVYCPEWTHSYDFYDNHTINAKFIQTKALDQAVCSFNTEINFQDVSYNDINYITYYENKTIYNPNIVPDPSDPAYTNRSSYFWVQITWENGYNTPWPINSLTTTNYSGTASDFCQVYEKYLDTGDTILTTPNPPSFNEDNSVWVQTTSEKYFPAILLYCGSNFKNGSPPAANNFSVYDIQKELNSIVTKDDGTYTIIKLSSENKINSTTLLDIYNTITDSAYQTYGGDGTFENPYILRLTV